MTLSIKSHSDQEEISREGISGALGKAFKDALGTTLEEFSDEHGGASIEEVAAAMFSAVAYTLTDMTCQSCLYTTENGITETDDLLQDAYDTAKYMLENHATNVIQLAKSGAKLKEIVAMHIETQKEANENVKH